MDGSKRSRHSNAFFTGFGGFRKIVLFDTLIQQLAEPELAAVLARSSFLVDGEQAGHGPARDVRLRDGAVIEVLPPFAGG